MSVFPGNQGPLCMVVAKAVAFGECLTDEFFQYAIQIKKNASSNGAFGKRGYKINFWWYDNHMMLIDLKIKEFQVKTKCISKSWNYSEQKHGSFDDKSPFVTSGIRGNTCNYY